MLWLNLILLGTVLGAAVLGAALIVAIAARYFSTPPTNDTSDPEIDLPVVFLFEDDDLVDATPSAAQLLLKCAHDVSDFEKFLYVFFPNFPSLRSDLRGLPSSSQCTFKSTYEQSDQVIKVRKWDGFARYSVRTKDTVDALPHIDALGIDALQDELETLRGLAESAPQLIWKQDDEGTITWANAAYLELVGDVMESGEHSPGLWPPQSVFGDATSIPLGKDRAEQRTVVRSSNQKRSFWFDVISLRRKIGSLHFAVGQNALVKAEEAQKNFVQTLTKTFADLPIGLAVFDLSRRLVLFNPALLDLTKLPVEFLMADPRLDDFLDKLRETRLLPEPKNYLNWRERITGIETEAQAGTYGETWNLPSGKVFRVTGRPHPNGAVAFLFEDISADVSSTRRFRSQIKVGQAVLDANPNGIALFSNLGTLTFSNKKFSGFLGLDGESTLADVNITDVTQMWQDQSQPSPIWSRINEFSNQLGDRGAWFDTFQLKDGRTIKCEVTPLIEGNTLCTFSLETMKTSMGKTEIGVLAASG